MIQDMTQNRYSMSFTSGALLRAESVTTARTYVETSDWEATRARILTSNLLQMRTLNASRRIFREVASRLKQLNPDQIDLLLDGSEQEQGYLLWLAFCRRYRFVYDFAVEVVREKFMRLDYGLTHEDYDVFFNRNAEWHPEMDQVSSATRHKQRQVVFKTMREAGLLSADNAIIPALFSPRLAMLIAQDNAADLAIFPISALDILNWTR